MGTASKNVPRKTPPSTEKKYPTFIVMTANILSKSHTNTVSKPIDPQKFGTVTECTHTKYPKPAISMSNPALDSLDDSAAFPQ